MGRPGRSTRKVRAPEFNAGSASPSSRTRSKTRGQARSQSRSQTRSATASRSRSRTPAAVQSARKTPEAVADTAIMEEEEDDMYGSTAQAPAAPAQNETPAAPTATHIQQPVKVDEEVEDDDDDDEEDDSDDDIEIITDLKPREPSEPQNHAQKPANAAVRIEAPRGGTPSGIPQIATPNQAASVPIGRIASPASGRPGSSYPEVKTSTLDLDGNPVLASTGKPILSTDMDADFAADTAPWRRPGSDMTDYYNYGFDEGTWAAYCIKQRTNRGEVAEDQKRMEQLGAMMGGNMAFGMDGNAAGNMQMPNFEQMSQMMGMFPGGMPGMPGMDASMGQGQNAGYQNQGGYGGGRNHGGRGRRW